MRAASASETVAFATATVWMLAKSEKLRGLLTELGAVECLLEVALTLPPTPTLTPTLTLTLTLTLALTQVQRRALEAARRQVLE